MLQLTGLSVQCSVGSYAPAMVVSGWTQRSVLGHLFSVDEPTAPFYIMDLGERGNKRCLNAKSLILT